MGFNKYKFAEKLSNMKHLVPILLITFSIGTVSSQRKADPRTVLMTKVQDTANTLTRTADTLGGVHKKIRALSPHDNPDGMVDIFVTVRDGVGAAELEAAGLHDVVMVNNVAMGKIAPSDMGQLEECDGVTAISLSRTGELHCDLARKDTNVDIVRKGGDGLPKGYDGSGVIVAEYDSGIEPGHLTFLDKDRKECRIRRIWHYTNTQNPDGTYATEETAYETPEAIAEFKTDNPDETHGTHTLGILAGSFGSGGEDKDHDYSGMAPGADILLGCGNVVYSNVARSIVRFLEYAEEEEKPLVINLSIGDNIGPHDGTDIFPRLLNEVGATVPIFISSGNEGRNKIALNKRFTGEDNTVRTVIIPRSTIRNHLGASWEAACEVQVWSEDDTPFTIETGLWDKSEDKWVFSMPVAPDGEASYIANGAYESVSTCQDDEFDYLYQDSAIGISTGYDPNNGRYTADIWYMLNKQINHIDRNIVPVLIVKGKDGKRVDIYCDGDYNEFGTSKMPGWDDGMTDGTISNIVCGENIFSVGSYCTRLILDPSVEGEVSDFTSWGILPDGRVLPDILAPGDHIVSAMSTPFTESEYFSTTAYPAVYGVMYGEDNPFYWTLLQGTSQASPAMAGIAALWLQANPELTPADIKRIVKETARPTSNMTPQCGAGKVDALAGIKEAIRMSGVETVVAAGGTAFVCTTDGPGCIVIDHASDFMFNVCAYDMTGRCVWQGQSVGGEPLRISSEQTGNGIFVIKMTTSKDMEVIKVNI